MAKSGSGMDTLKMIGSVFGLLGGLGLAGLIYLIVYGNLSGNLGFATGSSGYNNTQSVIGNITNGFTAFFSNYGTLFTILFVVALISIIAFIWVAFKDSKMGGSAATGFSG